MNTLFRLGIRVTCDKIYLRDSEEGHESAADIFASDDNNVIGDTTDDYVHYVEQSDKYGIKTETLEH